MEPIRFNDTSDYQFMDVLGVEGVFTNMRIDRDSLPEGFHKYAMRSGEEDFICQICNEVVVNHAGDFITKTPMDLGKEGRKELTPEDWGFTGKQLDFEEFFGKKYSFKFQVKQAEAKREAKAKERQKKAKGKAFPLDKEEPEH